MKVKWKKGDIVFRIVYKDEMYMTGELIVPCKIEKISTEDRIKSWDNKTVLRKKPKIIESSFSYPQQIAWINYVDPNGKYCEGWVFSDVLKRNPQEFLKEVLNLNPVNL